MAKRARSPVRLASVRQSERVSRIVERLSADGSVGVVEMAAELDVSPATVRRDLILMEEQRLLARTHGGAVAKGVLYELPLRYRGARRHEEKMRIAAAAAERVVGGSARADRRHDDHRGGPRLVAAAAARWSPTR